MTAFDIQPPTSAGMSGLPWGAGDQEQSPSIELPKITVVTPSFNQGKYLESCILSVLSQNYPNLEYIIIDGGSTDGSLDLIKKHQSQLAAWESGPDRGVYSAINKGFQQSSGEIMCWLNSSDMHCPWALRVAAEIFKQLPEVAWITSLYPMRWGENGLPIMCTPLQGHHKTLFYEGRCHMQQESTFWRSGLWEQAGGKIDESITHAGDFELWARYYQHADLYSVRVPLGGNRYHQYQKSAESAYQQQYQAVLKSGNSHTRSTVRRLVRALQLHEIPKLRVLIHRWLGYEMKQILGVNQPGGVDWQIVTRKELVN